MRFKYAGPAATVLFVLIGATTVSAKPLTIVDEYARTRPHRDEVDFSILFSREPDLWTVDEYDRQADAFQYRLPGLLDPDVLIEGRWIHETSALIPIRFGFGAATTTTVPFVLDGPHLTFTVPMAALGLSGATTFPYHLMILEYGHTMDRELDGWASPRAGLTPEPASWVLLGLGVVGVAGWKLRKGIG